MAGNAGNAKSAQGARFHEQSRQLVFVEPRAEFIYSVFYKIFQTNALNHRRKK
jgi:hypothetical protein